MIDEVLSAAVIDYVWGVPRKSWPTCRAASLSAEQLTFLPAIEAARRSADWVPPDWSDMAVGHARASAAVRRDHPALSDEAVAALADAYCYSWK